GDASERVGRRDPLGADRLGHRQDRVARHLDAEQAVGRGTRQVPGSGAVARSGAGRTASDRRARLPATAATTIEAAMTTTPTTIVVSSQNWNGKSWTRRSVAGSNRYDPAGKKT